MMQSRTVLRSLRPSLKKFNATGGNLMLTRSLSESPVDVDHAKGAWKTYGELDSYKPGKFQVGTFNKISTKVRLM